MSHKPDVVRRHCTWNNGEKAVVHLVESSSGTKLIQKRYKPGFGGAMLREYISLGYLANRLDVVPRLLAFSFAEKELLMSYVPGERVLEWVLRRFGQPGLDVDEFQNCPALARDPRIIDAFACFRRSNSGEASTLRQAIARSYRQLHSIGWQHGTSDPRNVIYDGERAYIIDFDRARPSLAPHKFDCPALEEWFGIRPVDVHASTRQ